MKKLAERHPEKLLDLLTERLTFERSGVKLYDIVMSADAPAGTTVALS